MTFLVSQEKASELFLLKPEYKKVNLLGVKYYAFDHDNMKILLAKDSVIKDLYLPVTNSYISNLEKQVTDLAGDVWFLEGELIEYKKKEKFLDDLKNTSIAALLLVATIEAIIISLK
jgi:hypothetical protein